MDECRVLLLAKGGKREYFILRGFIKKVIFFIYFFIFILNHSPMSNNLFAIFIEKKRLKWYVPTGI